MYTKNVFRNKSKSRMYLEIRGKSRIYLEIKAKVEYI
jgi:tRNA threonylcarbamoyladenosine modification (KEOPS) complex  Pcc1 subunit